MALDAQLAQSLNLSGQFETGIFVPHNRSIAGFPAEVTVEETERDEVTVTEHPVEQGAPISDHAFKRAEEVIIRVGWSIQKSGDLSADSGVYGFLLNLQASFQLFDLITGKRIHKNMLISSLWVTTDNTSEYSLMVTLSCREVILTQTQTTQTGISNNPSNHTNPEFTATPENGGVRPATDVDPAVAANTASVVEANGGSGASIEQTGR